MLARAALIFLLAPLCLCAGKEPQSEERLYKSKEWMDSSRLLIFTKQSQSNYGTTSSRVSFNALLFFSPGSVPVNFLKALLDATKDSNVTHFKVCII